MTDPFIKPAHVQGSPEWLIHRRNHIGASDAPIIMQESPWCTPYQLWERKLGLAEEQEMNAAMQRGIDMESQARAAFEADTGFEVFPQVVYHAEHRVMMASLDGLSIDGSTVVEIKCPGFKAHCVAISGNVPSYYKMQLQHQLACTGLDRLHYYSFDGKSGVTLVVERDDECISNMIAKELEFWKCVQTRTPPPLTDRDYVDRKCLMWANRGDRISFLDARIASDKREREDIRLDLIADADGQSSRGGGMTLTRTFPKGRVDYGAIPELEGVDLEPYRKEPKEQWTLRSSKWPGKEHTEDGNGESIAPF